MSRCRLVHFNSLAVRILFVDRRLVWVSLRPGERWAPTAHALLTILVEAILAGLALGLIRVWLGSCHALLALKQGGGARYHGCWALLARVGATDYRAPECHPFDGDFGKRAHMVVHFQVLVLCVPVIRDNLWSDARLNR